MGSLADVRQAYKDLRLTFDDPPARDPFLVSEDINEDTENNIINFTINLEKGRPEVIDDYSITVAEDSAGSLINVSIQGTISATGPKDCRLKKIRKYFCGTETCKASAKNINARYSVYCNGAYGEYLNENQINNLPADVVFCLDPLSISVTENTFAATISYNMQFDNRITHGHHKCDNSMSFKPSLQHIAEKELNRPTSCVNQSCGADDVGGQKSFDLLWMGFRDRVDFGIGGQIMVYDPRGGSPMESIATNKFRKYCGQTQDELQSERVESLDSVANATFSYKWGFHAPNSQVNAFGSLATINKLAIK